MSLTRHIKQLTETRILLLEVSSAKQKALIMKMAYHLGDDKHYLNNIERLLGHSELVNRLHGQIDMGDDELVRDDAIDGVINKVGWDRVVDLLEIDDSDKIVKQYDEKTYAWKVVFMLASLIGLFKVFEDIDPTNNMKYGNWLVDKALPQLIKRDIIVASKNNDLWSSLRSIYNRMGRFWEDIPKFKHYLTAYDEAKKKNELPEEYKDIMDMKVKVGWGVGASRIVINPIEQLSVITKDFRDKQDGDVFESIENQLEEGEDYYTIAEDVNDHNIYKPLSQKANSIMGMDTEWCTTYGEHCSNPEYMDRTPMQYDDLFILINTHTNMQLQFHFGSGQFMDAEDHPINVMEFFESHPDTIWPIFDEVPNDDLKKFLESKDYMGNPNFEFFMDEYPEEFKESMKGKFELK